MNIGSDSTTCHYRQQIEVADTLHASPVCIVLQYTAGFVRRSKDDEPPMDPANPASKPHATTKHQVSEMEAEGQAQGPGQEPPNSNDK
jgi:hypothetical protein